MRPATCDLVSNGHIEKVVHLYLTIAQLGFTQHASGQADGIQQHDGRAIKCFVGGEALSQGCALATGAVGSISGIPVYVSAAVTAGNGLILSSAAAEVYEDRIGALQVVEPSVLGVQVAYAGHFAVVVIEDAAIIKITSA